MGFIKKIVIIVGKLTRSGVLREEARLRRVPRGKKGVKKNFPLCGMGMGQDKTMRGGSEDLII